MSGLERRWWARNLTQSIETAEWASRTKRAKRYWRRLAALNRPKSLLHHGGKP